VAIKPTPLSTNATVPSNGQDQIENEFSDLFTLLKEIKEVFKGINMPKSIKRIQSKIDPMYKMFVLMDMFIQINNTP